MANSAIGSLMAATRDLGMFALRVSEGADMERVALCSCSFLLALQKHCTVGSSKTFYWRKTLLIVCWERIRKCVATYKNQELH